MLCMHCDGGQVEAGHPLLFRLPKNAACNHLHVPDPIPSRRASPVLPPNSGRTL